MQELHTRLRNFNLCVRTGGGKPPKTAERIYSRRIQRRGMAGIGSAPWGRKNYEIRGHAKNRDWKRATQLRLRQSLFQSQRMSPDFYFFQASFRSRLNHPHLRAEALSKRCSAVFYVHPAGSLHKQMQDRESGSKGGRYRQTKTFTPPLKSCIDLF